ncbi:O-antigen polymerase [Aurantibacter sp.]|uniref:O-antigen polymerase n=1 Tax=Aurantibacter sp. TaxID=2807103 RepID=UPI0035C7C7AD
MFGSLIFLLWILLLILSFIKTRDLFSPGKVFSAIFFVFFGDIFFTPYSEKVYLSILLIFFIHLILILSEKKINFTLPKSFILNRSYKKIVRRIWLLTTIPILAQLLLINKLGGLEKYILSIGLRVDAWKGLGYLIFFTKFINMLNYLYFIVILKLKNKTKNIKIIFFLHFLVFTVISLMSGSRSTLLWNLVFMMVYYNYNIKKVNFTLILSGALIIVILAMIIGVARDGYKYTDDGIQTGLQGSSKILKMSNFTYGLDPLELVLNNNLKEIKYGSTYVSAVTNLIPRKLWPGKPDTGGMVITKDYLNNVYGGFSYISPGLIPEAIINFGYFVGFIFSFIIMNLFNFSLLRFRRKQYTFRKNLKKEVLIKGIYPFLLFGVISYIYAEFTTNTISMMIFKVFTFYLIVVLCLPKKEENSLKLLDEIR